VCRPALRIRARTAVFAAALAGVLPVIGACTVAIPPPNSAEEQRVIAQGAEYDQIITAQYGVYEDAELEAYVDRVGERIAAVSQWPSLPWTFRVLDSAAVNAFAIPGGYIYVTRGLLAHMNSEAELAGVLGHEAAHVTGRHSAEQQRRATFATLGLLLGGVVSSDFAAFGLDTGLAQTAVGLTLLRYSRGQELESDEVGIGYAVAAGYDPSGIGSFFATLQAIEQQNGGRGVPGWASTHPEVDDRIARSRGWAAEALTRQGVQPANLVVNRQGHVRLLDGVVFGDNPREGFFEDHAFLHPDLRFRLQLPQDWQAINTRTAVQAVAPGEDAVVQLTLPQLEGKSREAYIADYLSEINAAVIDRNERAVNGHWARRVHFTVAGQSTDYEVLGVWVGYRDNLYQLLGISTPARYGRFDDAFAASFGSFDELRDAEALNVQPSRIELVTPPRAMSLSAVLQQHPEVSAEPATIALINAASLDAEMAPDRLVKLIEGDALLLATTRTRDGR
jgi:predicted Zn-dependent protease